jgi:hypothetical protein
MLLYILNSDIILRVNISIRLAVIHVFSYTISCCLLTGISSLGFASMYVMFQRMQANWSLSFDALTATCRIQVAITEATVCSFVAQSHHFWTVKFYLSCTKLELLQLVLKVCVIKRLVL